MIKSRLQLILWGASLALWAACGAQQKPVVPNDEVTVPMTAEDEEALDKSDDSPKDAIPAYDAGPAESP
jgi:hypothetical protein